MSDCANKVSQSVSQTCSQKSIEVVRVKAATSSADTWRIRLVLLLLIFSEFSLPSKAVIRSITFSMTTASGSVSTEDTTTNMLLPKTCFK